MESEHNNLAKGNANATVCRQRELAHKELLQYAAAAPTLQQHAMSNINIVARVLLLLLPMPPPSLLLA